MQQLKSASEMPGSYGLPYLGDTLRLIKELELYYWRQFQQYGPVFKGLIFGKKVAYLIGPDANRLVLVEQAEHMSSHMGWYFLEPLFGNNILLQDGEEHRVTRRLMYPAFHGKAIATYFDTVKAIVQDFLKNWGNLQDSQDVLGLLLAAVDEDGNKLSRSQIINEALLLLFAGHETTATLLSWTLFELGNHPEWRQRLREEQTAVVGNGELTVSHLKQFPQLTNVLKEAERLYPPVPGFSRGVLKEIEYAGYRIPAGWFVTISPMLTHRLPELYPDPDRFDPERFAPPREEDKKHPLALIGFGNGSHSCLGFELAQMEMKIVLSTLLRHYDWTVTPGAAIAPVRQLSKVQDNLRAHVTPVETDYYNEKLLDI